MLCDDLESQDEGVEGGSIGRGYTCVCVYMCSVQFNRAVVSDSL